MDISLLCRSCMKEIKLLEIDSYSERIAEMFCYCTKIELHTTPDDNLPKSFCHNCTKSIELCYNFIKEAHRADVALKNVISRSRTVIVQPDNLKEDHNHLKLNLPDHKLEDTIKNENQCDTIDNLEFENDFHEISEDCKRIQQPEDNKEEIKDIINGVNKYTCPVCQKCFTSKKWYSRHIEREQGSKYNCPHCSKAFLRSSQLSHHITSHSQERRFACSLCGKKYKRWKQLAVHKRSHADKRPYGCDKCGMRFKFKSVLKCHMEVHEDFKQFLCWFCGWSFTHAGNLNVHMRKHTGDKPFKCDECPFKASVASSLRRHQRMHRGTKTHVCPHCRKGFYDAGALTRHRRTHTGELPYKCPVCDRGFVDNWKRKTHLMRTHQMELHDIPKMTKDGQTIDT
ncbi:hypothetical protein K1T71_002942 [Dendrolimus kikuchii]|uniref:Uncharacterized protein n=1 Tax=Dendrolimus kikuchii TaxID=765133 RepID=A0ACC1DAG3_9NEOP|nr:hypothetical protein K1T71_002942 [Dendrolimus kikuchii]